MEQAASVFNHSVHTTAKTSPDQAGSHFKGKYLYLYIIGEPEKSSKNENTPNSVVNLLKNVVKKPVKIGFSRNPWARTTDLQRSTNPNLTLLAYVRVAPGCPSQLPDVLQKAGKKKGWYFMDGTVKALIYQIKEKTFSGFKNWCEKPLYGTWYRGSAITPEQPATDHSAENNPNEAGKKPSEKITTKRTITNSLNKNKDITNKNQPKNEDNTVTLMTLDWMPSPVFDQMKAKHDLPPMQPEDIIEFKLYWMDRRTTKTAAQWDMAFIRNQRRLKKWAEAEREKRSIDITKLVDEKVSQLLEKLGFKGDGMPFKPGFRKKAANTETVTQPWPQAFKEFEKDNTMITEEAKRKNQAAQTDHMRQAMASLGMRRKKE